MTTIMGQFLTLNKKMLMLVMGIMTNKVEEGVQ
jgi:hypothetical protein